MSYTYQVEFTDDDGREHVEPYGDRLSAAISRARRASDKEFVAYVVASKTRNGSEMACGHKAYSQGCVIETDGEGF
jgi:hypothetical protein